MDNCRRGPFEPISVNGMYCYNMDLAVDYILDNREWYNPCVIYPPDDSGKVLVRQTSYTQRYGCTIIEWTFNEGDVRDRESKDFKWNRAIARRISDRDCKPLPKWGIVIEGMWFADDGDAVDYVATYATRIAIPSCTEGAFGITTVVSDHYCPKLGWVPVSWDFCNRDLRTGSVEKIDLNGFPWGYEDAYISDDVYIDLACLAEDDEGADER